jgi:hypothetical protein
LKTFYHTLLENEVENIDQINHTNLFFDDMLSLLEANVSNFNLTVELMIFFSVLTNKESSEFKTNLQSSKKFLKIIKKILDEYNSDENSKKIISQCIAQLPIEDLQSAQD